MKHARRLAAVLSALLWLGHLLSCENPMDPNNVGLGTEVDLVGPTLTIVTPAPMGFVGPDFVMSGTCRDNVKVTRVVVENLATGDSWEADISGETWSLPLSLPENEQTLRVTAYDHRGNTSEDSTRTLSVIVDNTPPAVDPATIRVNRSAAYYASLRALVDLKGITELSFETLDLIQNGTFSLSGSTRDNFRLDRLTLSLRGEDDTVIHTVTINDGDLPNASWSGSLYNWSFPLDTDTLYAAGTPAADGRVYLSVHFNTADKHGNTDDIYCGWMALDPDSDFPWPRTEGMDHPLSVQATSPLAFSGVDDDGVAEVYGTIVPVDQAPAVEAALAAGTWGSHLTVWGSGGATMPRLLPVQAVAPSTPGLYQVFVAVEDSSGVMGYRSWSLSVLDVSFPVTVITSPADNTFPSLTGGTTFTLNGYGYDNSGVSSVRIAWIPAALGEGYLGVAETALADYTGPGTVTTPDGIVIRPVTLGASAPWTAPDGSPSFRREFSVSYDILSDFSFGGAPEYASRYFVLYCVDSLGNATTQTFRLSADRTLPQLNVLSPAGEISSHDPDGDLVLRFTAGKANGMAVDQCGVTETVSGSSYTPVYVTGAWQVVLPSASLSEGRLVFDFSAEDLFGNRSVVRRTVDVTDRPVLESVTSSVRNGSYKQGDVLSLQARFSKPVTVNVAGGTPRLRVFPVEGGPVRELAYVSGTGTDTLLFTLAVQPGDSTSDLACDTAEPITLNGGEICNDNGLDAVITLSDPDQSLQSLKAISLDGIAPTVTGVTSPAGAFYGPGSDYVLTVTFSESVNVSGNPVFKVGSTQGLHASYVTVSGNTMTFRYRVTSGINDNAPVWNTRLSLADDAADIKDAAGNPLSLPAAGVNLSLNGVIDTDPPDPPLIASPAAGSYNTAQVLTIVPPVDSQTTYFSLNGGITWEEYTGGENLPGGSYTLTTRCHDAAGNISDRSTPITVTINDTFPSVTGVFCEQPDGIYKEGESLVFKLVFASPVRTGATLPSLSLVGGYTATARAEASGDTVLWFDYTVQPGDTMNPVTVSGVNLAGVTDLFGNTAGTIPLPLLSRPGLRVDAAAPVVQTRNPHNGVGAGTSLTLTFNEPVNRASGTITIRRRAGWLIPPVLSVEDFNEVYQNPALTDLQRSYLMETNPDGTPILDGTGTGGETGTTGQPRGPYRLNTYGLTVSGGEVIPDTTGKYVLAYAYDIDNADIRSAFEAAGYHQVVIDVLSSQVSVSGSTVTITPDEPLPVGRDWEVLVDAGAFEDDAGNGSAAQVPGDWEFSTDQVATPVIRVNKVSGNSKTVAHPVTTTFRIDCETPDADIDYLVVTRTYGVTGTLTAYDGAQRLLTSDASLALFQNDISGSGEPGTDYTGEVTIGDGSYTTAQRIYIKARASKTGYTDSDIGHEGAYKTTCRMTGEGNTTRTYYTRGSNNGGGQVTIPGFPIRWLQTNEPYYAKATFRNGTDWTWVTWQINSTFEYKFNDGGGAWVQDNNLRGSYGAMSLKTGGL